MFLFLILKKDEENKCSQWIFTNASKVSMITVLIICYKNEINNNLFINYK